MAKTYEALMKAEEEAQKKQADRGLPSSSVSGPSTGAPELSSDSRGPSTMDRGLSFDFDEYYHLKLNILRSSPNGKIKSLLFLSPTGGEGASTVLAQFAVALAGQGEKVLLVDANFRSPSLHQQFNLERDIGLIDLLLGKSTLSEVIQNTSLDTLWVITAGTLHHELSSAPGRGPSTVDHGLSSFDRRLFSSNRLDSYMAQLKEQADWVLFDGPPVNHFDEGLALSGKVDGVVMVLQAEKTRWEVAQAAKQRLQDSGGKILGVVLNKRKFYIPKWLYKTL